MAKKKPKANVDAAPQAPPADALGLDAFRAPPTDDGISLERLTDAFAEMLGGRGDDPYEPPPTADPPADDPVAELAERLPSGPADEPDDSACEISPQTILEAMLFVGDPDGRPVSAQWVSGLMRGVRPAEIDAAVADLNDRYARGNCPYEIVSEAEGYRLALRPQYRALSDKVFGRTRAVRLSQSAVEVLALVAYRGGLKADEVSKLRGRPSKGLLNQLLRRRLLRLERSEHDRPRDARFVPTARFLELFGLESLDELPRPQDVERR